MQRIVRKDYIYMLHNATDFDVFKRLVMEYARENGFYIDERELESVKTWKAKFGKFYCPCKIIPFTSEKERQHLICPCSSHLADIMKTGSCCCKLFIKKSQ